MKLSIFDNDLSASHTMPFVLSIDLSDEVIPPHTHFLAPLFVEQGEDSPRSFHVELCGFRLEADSPQALLAPSAQLLSGLINHARLPTYVFVAGDSLQVFPVYTIGDEVMATTPGGPIFRHVELAKVRSYLSEYLHTMQLLGAVDHLETLHVRGVDSSSLGLIRPRFYLKKRVPGENAFWAPVFPSVDGQRLYAYAASAKHEIHTANALAILALHDRVAGALIADGRLRDPYDLRPDRLFPQDWEALKAHLSPQPYSLQVSGSKRCVLPIFRRGNAYLAVEHRIEENRYQLFLGRNPRDLLARVVADLERRGLIKSAEEVTLQAFNPPVGAPSTGGRRLSAEPLT